MIQLYVHYYKYLFFKFFSHLGYYVRFSRVPYALEQILAFLFFSPCKQPVKLFVLDNYSVSAYPGCFFILVVESRAVTLNRG